MRTIIDLEEAILPNYDFTLTDLDGKAHRLSEERGRRGLLQEPRGRRWSRRGPSLPVIAELVRRIGDER